MSTRPLVTIDASDCTALAVCRCGWRSGALADAPAALAAAARHTLACHRDVAYQQQHRALVRA